LFNLLIFKQTIYVCHSIFSKSPQVTTYTEATSALQLGEKHLLDDSVLEEQQQQLVHHSPESPNGRHKHDEGSVGEEGEQLLTTHGYVRFEVFMAVTMKNGLFWDVTPCGSCMNRRFGGT
jgi:hypothetical protein